MNQTKTEAKEVIRKACWDCFQTWIMTPRDMQEILISLAGELAVNERNLTLFAPDAATPSASEGQGDNTPRR